MKSTPISLFPLVVFASSGCALGDGASVLSDGLAADFRALVVISEVMASPLREATGEYIEVANVTYEQVDMSGWSVRAGEATDRLAGYRGGTTVIPPQSLALIVDADHAGDFALPAGMTILTTRDRAIGAGIGAAHKVKLIDRDGVVVDQFSPPLAPIPRGTAVERIDWYLADSPANWSAAAGGGSPGSPNRATAPFGIRPIFGDDNDQGALIAGMVDFIDSARESVDGQIYQFNQPDIAAALKRAAVRTKGRVRMVFDTNYKERPGYREFYLDLGAAQTDPTDGAAYAISIVFDNKASRAHNKFLVADGRRVWVGSYNPTAEGGLDNAVIFDSPEMATAFTTEFEEMYGDPVNGVAGRFGKNKKDNTEHEFRVAGSAVEVYFAPTDGPRAAVVRAIDAAKSSVRFQVFSFNDEEIGAALLRKARGAPEQGVAPVKVTGVIDHIQATYPGSQYHLLYAESQVNPNVDVRVTPSGLKMHNKLAIIDADGDEPAVVTGSYNWSGARADTNDESLVIVRERRLATRYAIEFARAWELVDGANDPEGPKQLRITEVMSNPVDDGTGEFVEIFNAGASAANLEGLFISDGTKKSRLMARKGGSTLLQPGAFAVLVDKQWKGDPVIPEGTVVVTVSTSAICGSGLAPEETLTLETPRGRELDRWSAKADLGAVRGFSVERVDAALPEGGVAVAYRKSLSSGGSAGQANRGSQLGSAAR